ncbi:MAG TPA: response regulator transcription factor [Longimicrobium sp.]
MDTIRVLLVDDHAVLRAGLRVLLEAEAGIQVVGDAASGEEGIRKAEELRPDVVVMDLSMPRMDGLEATRRMTAAGLPARVLVLTVDAEADSLVPVLEAGAAGYVTKGAPDGQLVEAIRVVGRGDPFLPPGSVRLLTDSLRAGRPPAPPSDPLSLLSTRERDVLALTAEGFSSAEIGERLGLSHKTVDTYRQRLMGKLGLHRRNEVVHFALDHGLLAAATV